MARHFRLALFFCLFLGWACAQVTQTPVITSLQSSTTLNDVPDHGNAITSGAPLEGFYLWINGNFNTQLFESVRWVNTSTNEVYVCYFDSNCYLDLNNNRIRISIPYYLFVSPVSSQVAVQVTVTERFDANASTSNVVNFFINPRPTAIPLPNAFRNLPYTGPLISGGTAPFSLDWTSLPAGLTLQTNDPVLRGTPTAPVGIYYIGFFLDDAWGVAMEASSELRILDPITVTGLSPSSRVAGSGNFDLTVTGTGFQAPNSDSAGSRIVFGGSLLTTTFISSTSLRATVPGTLINTPGSIPVLVRTSFEPDSNSVNFTVLPASTILSLNPIFAIAGGQSFNLTVTGTNFPNPTVVVFNGTPVTTSYISPTQVTAVVPASLIATAGIANVTVSNSFGVFGPLTFTIRPLLIITTPSLPAGTAGSNYSFQMTAIGGNGSYNWSATGLPDGLTINPSTGLISGNTRIGGTSTVAVTVRDSQGQVTGAQYQLQMIVINPPLNISGSLPNGVVGVSYDFALTGSGGSGQGYGFSITGGTLPPGLTLTSQGVFTGIPTTVGTFRFVVGLSDSVGASIGRDYSIQILPPPLTVTGAVSDTPLGSPLSTVFGATGGVPPYRFAVTGSIPPGTLFSGSTLSGTPNSIGTFEFTVAATDSAGTVATKAFTIKVTAPPLQLTGTAGNGQVGTPYSASFGANGGVPAYTFTATGLPAGLRLDGSNITGTPTADGTFQVSITVTDTAGGRASGTFTVVISVPALRITTTSLPNGAFGQPYSASLAATGGVPPYNWSVSGAPDGVTATSSGAVSGIPTRAGSFAVAATVTDSKGTAASASFSVTIAAPPLEITTASLSVAVLGASYSTSLAATGGAPPYTWLAAQLPPGITLSPAGALSGTPTSAGSFNVAVTVTDSLGTSTNRTFPVTVALPQVSGVNVNGLPPTSNPGTQPGFQFVLGEPYPAPVTVTATLTFTPDSGQDDPAVQFAGGGRTITITIPAGATTAPNVQIQAGTVAGTVTITFRLAALSSDITPTPVPTRTVRITPAPPVITSVTATRNATGFTVTVSGFASTREITQALFTFTGAPGANLQTTQITAPVDTLFAQWFGSSVSAPFGSQFVLTWTFNVQGDTSAIASVGVTLTNRLGNSNVATANLQ